MIIFKHWPSLTSEDFSSLPLLVHRTSEEMDDNETFDAPDEV